MAACDLTTLQTDACTNGFAQAAQDETMFRAILLQLACNIASGGGPGGAQQVFSGNYGGGEPSQTPTADEAIAIDTSTGDLWKWYSGAWH